LRRYLAGETRIEGLHRGHAQRHDETIAALNSDGDAAQIAEMWIGRGNHAKVLDLWVRGLEVSWQRLHAGPPPARLRLPTYVFEKERHWVASLDDSPYARRSSTAEAWLHPLLQRNTSSLYVTRFSSRLTGRENFLSGRGLHAGRMLPGMAPLERARAAAERAVEEVGTAVVLR